MWWFCILLLVGGTHPFIKQRRPGFTSHLPSFLKAADPADSLPLVHYNKLQKKNCTRVYFTSNCEDGPYSNIYCKWFIDALTGPFIQQELAVRFVHTNVTTNETKFIVTYSSNYKQVVKSNLKVVLLDASDTSKIDHAEALLNNNVSTLFKHHIRQENLPTNSSEKVRIMPFVMSLIADSGVKSRTWEALQHKSFDKRSIDILLLPPPVRNTTIILDQAQKTVLRTFKQKSLFLRQTTNHTLPVFENRKNWKLEQEVDTILTTAQNRINKVKMANPDVMVKTDLSENESLERAICDSKIIVSPWFHGQWATADLLASWCGTIIVKPSTSRTGIQTGVPIHKWAYHVAKDFSNLDFVLERIINEGTAETHWRHKMMIEASRPFLGYANTLRHPAIFSEIRAMCEDLGVLKPLSVDLAGMNNKTVLM